MARDKNNCLEELHASRRLRDQASKVKHQLPLQTA